MSEMFIQTLMLVTLSLSIGSFCNKATATAEKEVTIRVGNLLCIDCFANDTSDLIWTLNDETVHENSESVNIQGSFRLCIKPVLADDGGFYRCKKSDGTALNEVRVFVQTPAKDPECSVVNNTVHCASTVIGDSLTWFDSRTNDFIKKCRLNTSTTECLLYTVTPDQLPHLICRATSEFGYKERKCDTRRPTTTHPSTTTIQTTQAPVTVTIKQDPPVITSNVTFLCEASEPFDKLQWKFGTKILDDSVNNIKDNLLKVSGGSLHISNLQPDVNGTVIKCLVGNLGEVINQEASVILMLNNNHKVSSNTDVQEDGGIIKLIVYVGCAVAVTILAITLFGIIKHHRQSKSSAKVKYDVAGKRVA